MGPMSRSLNLGEEPSVRYISSTSLVPEDREFNKEALLASINRDAKLSEADKSGVNNLILAADGFGNRDGKVALAELKDAVNGKVAAERDNPDALLNRALSWARDPVNDPRYLRIAELHMQMLPPVTDPALGPSLVTEAVINPSLGANLASAAGSRILMDEKPDPRDRDIPRGRGDVPAYPDYTDFDNQYPNPHGGGSAPYVRGV